MNDFTRDDLWQKKVRDTVLAPGFYGRFGFEGRYVFIDKGRLAETLQRRFAVDTIVQGKAGRAVCIEEKIVRWPGYRYDAYCLETDSCTRPGRESQGWMHYGQADYLFYCFVQPARVECHLIDFPALRAWFWPVHATFPTFGPLATLNASAGRKAPIAAVRANVPTTVHVVFPNLADPLAGELFPDAMRDKAA